MSTNHRGIVVEGLVRDLQGRHPRRRRHRPRGRGRRDLRLPRAQRRGQVDHRPHAHDAAAAHRGPRDGGGLRRRHPGRRRAPPHRRGAPGGRAGQLPDRAASTWTCRPASAAWPRPTASAAATELLERVGLTEAADRKVGGYSGGMKRRLDLALALVHSPSILFLDEPTTGLDPQSRSALWDEVAAPGHRRRRDGLPHHAVPRGGRRPRRPRRDHRPRAGSSPRARPDELKREIGGDTVEAIPADPHDLERAAEVLARFGEGAAHSPKGVAVRLSRRRRAAGRHRARARRRGHRARAPAAALARRSTTSSWPRPGARWRARGEEGEAAAEEPVPA